MMDHKDIIKKTWELDRSLIVQKFTYDVDDWFHMIVAIEGRTWPWKPLLLTMGWLQALKVCVKFHLSLFWDKKIGKKH